MWRKHCFGAERNYKWCFKIHIVQFNPKSLDDNWKLFSLHYNAAHDKKRPQFTDFVTLVNEKIELEKFIAITANKLLSFNKKWSNFLNN